MIKSKNPVYIFVSGGVLSGVGKGITTASIALLLKSRGIRVNATKCDMYLNIDAGTMNPVEHGEVFVTGDKMETDQDIGHYERFLGESLGSKNYITAGQVYKSVLERERSLGYGGQTVDTYQEVPEEIIRKIDLAARGVDIAVVELGGTVGEYQNIMFFEAIRRLKIRKPGRVALVHVGYVPFVKTIGEIKSKPLQQSIHELNSLGLQPDFVIARAEKKIDKKRIEKIAFAASLPVENIFSNPDVETIYEVPLILEEQSISEKILKLLKIKSKKTDLVKLKNFVAKAKVSNKEIKIGLVGKYVTSDEYSLEDAYVCVNEAIKHASWSLGYSPKIILIDSEKLEKSSVKEFENIMSEINGLVVPQGWGSRGTVGKIRAIEYARKCNLPFLGLCFGMQMAVVEFAKNVAGLKDANPTEITPNTKNPVIHIMPNQAQYLVKKQFGGTIRLGDWECRVIKNSLLYDCYKKSKIFERHRHRYEFNMDYKKKFENLGLKISGISPDGKLIEAIELDKSLHKFFLGVQFHPELISRPLSPHPIFTEFIKSLKSG